MKRKSTKDRFVSVLRGGDPYRTTESPWYKRRSNYLPLLMILLFLPISVVVKTLNNVQDTRKIDSTNPVTSEWVAPEKPALEVEEPTEEDLSEGNMDIDDAIRLFINNQPESAE